MLELLYGPVQAFFRWMDENPGARLTLALSLFALAILAPIPGWMLDLWLIAAVGGAAGMAGLLVVVGSELHPREALAGLPAFLRRFAFHRLALSLALTKAVLLGRGAGTFMDWLAHNGLGGSVGVGLAAVSAIYAARLACAYFPQFERLSQTALRLPVEFNRMEHAVAAGRLSPSAARRKRKALTDEIQLLADARQIFRLVRNDALGGLALTVCLLGAGLVTGLVFKGWPWSLTLAQLTLYGLCETIFSALPALLFGVTLSQWLGSALEAEGQATQGRDEAPDAPGLPMIAVEVGRELGALVRRGFAERTAVSRARLLQELGLPLPRVEVSTGSGLPPRGYRISVRGGVVATGELGDDAPLEALAWELEASVHAQAATLLTLDATQSLLDELAVSRPVAVAQALERLGLPTIHAVLVGLLREGVSMRDLAGIVDALVGVADTASAPALLIEHLRRDLAGAISSALADERGVIHAFELTAAWEDTLTGYPGGLSTIAERADAQDLANACRETVQRLCPPGVRPALVVPRRFRPLVAEAVADGCPQLAVLAPEEIAHRYELRLVGLVDRPTIKPFSVRA